ncbi:putative streptomycin biosynthesis operon regulatory protein [Vibrio phage CHOED]|uniref:putative streptomycin biosynthesis operon regulatory protein n=1 Tax=Vibrio phage CHOED TaxID=1458716 RepID=UPI00042EDC27|nr:putative streptomycin biosynthesis operon regulatory protein [Vibrio phage CHOED]AHK11943.1 putative streptomycin biosynthesis operon regulatory protein [Vibrio phage CHOED]
MSQLINVEDIQSMFVGAIREQVNLSTIVIDAGTQQRASVDKQAIENYAEAMLAGQANNFPAIELVELTEPVSMPDGSVIEAGARVLVDGFQRTSAALIAKLGTFHADIVKGTLKDAIYYSMTANRRNGVNFKGNDYQNAIKQLYLLDGGYWRAHGRKQEIAALLGCSAKTVERATAAIDKKTKAEAFAMFEQGATLQEVAEFAFKSEKTIKEWFAEWQDIKAKQGANEGQGEQGTNQEQSTNAGENNPLDLTFAQVLALTNTDLKNKLLRLLMDSCGYQGEPQQEDAQPNEEPQEDDSAPFDTDEESNENPMGAIASSWRGRDWWDVLELDLAALQGLKNPKAAIKRAYNKQLKRVHSDKFGENEALEILKDALAAANTMFK